MPLVRMRCQGEGENAVSSAFSGLAVSVNTRKQFNELCPTGSNDKFSDATPFIEASIRIQRRKPFVVVLMSVQHHVDMRFVHEAPKRIEARVVAVPSGTETRVMKISQGALSLML